LLPAVAIALLPAAAIALPPAAAVAIDTAGFPPAPAAVIIAVAAPALMPALPAFVGAVAPVTLLEAPAGLPAAPVLVPVVAFIAVAGVEVRPAIGCTLVSVPGPPGSITGSLAQPATTKHSHAVPMSRARTKPRARPKPLLNSSLFESMTAFVNMKLRGYAIRAAGRAQAQARRTGGHELEANSAKVLGRFVAGYAPCQDSLNSQYMPKTML
jgi:hypothetical protein